MNVYFVRHGQTQENSRGVYYGKRDISLNETGRNQCMLAGKMLRDIVFDRIYISERKRTKESAEIILNAGNNDFITDKRINERSFGIFEGMTYEQIKQKYLQHSINWENDWVDYVIPDGESYTAFYNRIASFIYDLEKIDAENVLVVTHGGVIKTAYCVLLGNKMLYWKFASKNADVSIIKFEYGNWYIDSITHVNGSDKL